MLNRNVIKAVFLDSDDTLLTVYPSTGIIYQSVLKDFSLHFDLNAIKNALRKTWNEFIPYYENHGGAYQTFPAREREIWREFSRRTLQDLGINEPENTVLDTLYTAFSVASSRRLAPGAHEALVKLKQLNKYIGLISNNDSRIHTILKGFDIIKYFDGIFPAEIIGFKKPSLKCFKTVETLSGFSSEEIVYLGDSIRHDYEPARACGWQAVLYSPEADAARDKVAVTSFNEFIALV